MNQTTQSNKLTRWIVVISIPVVISVIVVAFYFVWLPVARITNGSADLAENITVKGIAGAEKFVVTIPELFPGETFVIRRNCADLIVTSVNYHIRGNSHFVLVTQNITPTEKLTFSIEGEK